MSSECGASCLLNGASCLLNVGRVVLWNVFFGASCLGASCLWGELSVIRADGQWSFRPINISSHYHFGP